MLAVGRGAAKDSTTEITEESGRSVTTLEGRSEATTELASCRTSEMIELTIEATVGAGRFETACVASDTTLLTLETTDATGKFVMMDSMTDIAEGRTGRRPEAIAELATDTDKTGAVGAACRPDSATKLALDRMEQTAALPPVGMAEPSAWISEAIERTTVEAGVCPAGRLASTESTAARMDDAAISTGARLGSGTSN